MSWLLFLDESGHDHKNMPFEVRGGVTIAASRLFSFIQSWRRLEEDCFGTLLSSYGKEAKGAKLLDKDRIKWALQEPRLGSTERRKLARAFLEIGRDKGILKRHHFTAYGQASLEMARGVFDLLRSHDAKLFATLIPLGTKPPQNFSLEDYLRKDHVFLFERYFYFLEASNAHGLIVMDETEKNSDRKFVKRLEAYFEKTATGRNRASLIVPSPLFVASDMSYAVQAADLCLYCINWVYRLPGWTQDYPIREDMMEFSPKISNLQWMGDIQKQGKVHRCYGIVLVRDPYTSRTVE